jgi:hypothetical protein
MKRLRGQEGSDSRIGTGGFYGEGWTPKEDVRGFAMILFEIAVGRLVNEAEAANLREIHLLDVPEFISEIIREELSPNSGSKKSFLDIFNILKRNEFRIFNGVNSDEVSEFVNRVELAEQSVE